MSDPVTTEQQIRFLTNVVSRLVARVAQLNVDAYVGLDRAPNERQKSYGDINEELNELRTTLEAYVQRWDQEGKPPQTPSLPK